MRKRMRTLAMLMLGVSGIVLAQPSHGATSRNNYVDFDAPELHELVIVKIVFRGGCFLYKEAGNGEYVDWEDDEFTWSGRCVKGQPVNGNGTHKRITKKGSLRGDWTEISTNVINGVMHGSYTWKSYVAWNSPGERNFNGSGTFNKGCDPQYKEGFNFCSAEFSQLAERLNAKNQPAASKSVAQNSPLSASDGARGAGSATSGRVGQNLGKGGNPDWLYDDVDHGKCVSVQSVSNNTGSQMAYGHYKLINNCAYPIKLNACITSDRADGTPSPNFDQHQVGQKCPGMGRGGTTLDANGTSNGKQWFEYSHLKWDILVCREGWDFIGEDGKYPSDIIGIKYSCRKRRS